MRVRGFTARAQRMAESLMLDTCRIRAVTGNTTNTTTGVAAPIYGAAVYEGKCKVQQMRGALPSTPDAGEHRWTVAPLELHLPVVGTAAVKTDHLVEVLASVDAANVGRKFRIRTGDRKSFQSAVRFAVEEVTD